MMKRPKRSWARYWSYRLGVTFAYQQNRLSPIRTRPQAASYPFCFVHHPVYILTILNVYHTIYINIYTYINNRLIWYAKLKPSQNSLIRIESAWNWCWFVCRSLTSDLWFSILSIPFFELDSGLKESRVIDSDWCLDAKVLANLLSPKPFCSLRTTHTLYRTANRSDMMTRTRMKVHNRILHLNRVCQYLFDCRAASRRNWPPLLSRISIPTTAMYW